MESVFYPGDAEEEGVPPYTHEQHRRFLGTWVQLLVAGRSLLQSTDLLGFRDERSRYNVARSAVKHRAQDGILPAESAERSFRILKRCGSL